MSNIPLDGEKTGVELKETGVEGQEKTKIVVEKTATTVKGLIENSDTFGENELKKLEKTTNDTKKFFKELSPLKNNIEELATHLGITIIGLEEDKKENQEGKSFYKGIKNKAKQLIVKASHIKLIGPIINKALVSAHKSKKSAIESIGTDEIINIEESYKNVLNSFTPIYEKLETEYNSLNEELEKNKSELKKYIEFLGLNNLTQEEILHLEYIKSILEERIKNTENIIKGHENNVKFYQVYAVFLKETFPKEFSKMQDAIILKQSSKVTKNLGEVFIGIQKVSDNATKSAFEELEQNSLKLLKSVNGTKERKKLLKESVNNSMKTIDKNLAELSELLAKKPTLPTSNNKLSDK